MLKFNQKINLYKYHYNHLNTSYVKVQYNRSKNNLIRYI